MPNDPDFIIRARDLTAEQEVLIALYRGRRVRVLRAIVYEGDGETVLQQLARSLPVGTRDAHKGKLTITVHQDEIQVLDDPPTEPARLTVAQLDPSDLLGIVPCDDGEEGWCIVRRDGSDDTCLVSDDIGPIVYMDVKDAAEVLRTGIVWKHDMGEDEATDDPDSGPLDASSSSAT